MALVMEWTDVKNRAPAGEVTAADQARVTELLADALADARRYAPCLATTIDPDVLQSAKGIVSRAVLAAMNIRPGIRSEQYPEYGYELETPDGGSFTAVQIAALQALCRAVPESGVYEMDHGMAHYPTGR